MLAVSSPVILSELESLKVIAEKWIEKIQTGIPGVDLPAPDDRLELFLRELCGELLLCAGKCESLSTVLSGEVR